MKSTLRIKKETAAKIERLLNTEPRNAKECMGEDETIIFTTMFPNSYYADVKICGVKYREGESNLPWCEAVLYDDKDCEVSTEEVYNDFFRSVTLIGVDAEEFTVDIQKEG